MLVLGVGNRYRRDDGAGPVVAERLAAKGLSTRELSGEGVDLMDSWEGCDFVVLVDAASSKVAPGTIHRFEAAEAVIPAGLFHYSSHQFAVAEAVEMARILGRLPRRLLIYGIEGRDFSYGEELSSDVATAVDSVVSEIAAIAESRGS